MKIFKKEDFAEANVFGTGAENTGYAQYFQGEFLPQSADRSENLPGVFGECHV